MIKPTDRLSVTNHAYTRWEERTGRPTTELVPALRASRKLEKGELVPGVPIFHKKGSAYYADDEVVFALDCRAIDWYAVVTVMAIPRPVRVVVQATSNDPPLSKKAARAKKPDQKRVVLAGEEDGVAYPVDPAITGYDELKTIHEAYKKRATELRIEVGKRPRAGRVELCQEIADIGATMLAIKPRWRAAVAEVNRHDRELRDWCHG